MMQERVAEAGAPRVAIFVDGDNLAPGLAPQILASAARLGRTDLRRVYAGEPGMRAWAEVPGFGLRLAGGSKNAADLLLCIEATALACEGGYGTVALASDDRDFSHLALWLRERGLVVLGLGTAKSPAGWQAACTKFEWLQAPPSTSVATPPKAAPALSLTDRRIRDVIMAEGGSIGLVALNGRMQVLHGLRVVDLGATSWRAYMRSRPDLYAADPKGHTARVRWVGP